jgi:lipopolysaccharide transport system ATP-binding protein
MNDVMVRVENLNKLYYIGAVHRRHDTLIQSLATSVSRTVRRIVDPRLARIGADEVQELWALKDVSFELKRGEVLGIIGSNGSGKSTLLKILSRVTAPTSGRADLYGRVGSLLEVGTGFHPDLTGRENVYLNGAILGMKSAQIDRIFDEIVDFSGVEKFIDTPVKHYSSGMYVRLAFAVAAHFDPDILILDEVLAVGDAGFTRKSLEKMEGAAKNGKTVLFVSHALSSVMRLCDHGLYLDQGKIVYAGTATDTVSTYLKKIHQIDDERMEAEGGRPTRSYMDLGDNVKRWGGSRKILTWVSTHRIDDTPATEFNTGEGMKIRIGYHLDGDLNAYCNVNFLNYTGLAVMTVGLHHTKPGAKLSGDGYLECCIPELRLVSGNYILMLSIGEQDMKRDERRWMDSVSDTIHIKVEIGDYLHGYEVSQLESSFAQRSEWGITPA